MPPVPGKDVHNPLQGMQQSKIDFYGLGEIVKKYRFANMGYVDIANRLNMDHLADGCPTISTMAVQRWCKKNIRDEDNPDCRENQEQAINIYGEKRDVLNSIQDQIDTINLYMDQLNKMVKEKGDVIKLSGLIKDQSFLMLKWLAQKQMMLKDVETTQDKIYNFNNFNKALTIITDMIKAKDVALYADILSELSKDQQVVEMLRSIEPEKKK
jgi:vacuolar-type H+-ATPase subunit I/STV1